MATLRRTRDRGGASAWWNERARKNRQRRGSTWWSEQLETHRRPLARAASILLGCEHQWIHRRTHWVDFTGNGIRWTMAIDFAVPLLREYPRALPLIVPLSMPEKETSIFDLDVRDGDGHPLPVLTGAENSALSAEILRHQAEQVLGRRLEPKIDCQLRLIAGDDLAPGDGASIAERMDRARFALAYLESLDDRAPTQLEELELSMHRLWNDPVMRGLMHALATRFIVFVEVSPLPLRVDSRPTRRIVTISYERELFVLPKDVIPLESTNRIPSSKLPLPAIRQSLSGSFRGLLKMREPLNAQSTHIHVACLDELLVTRASAQQVILKKDHGARPLLEVLPPMDGAAVERTQQVHLHLTPEGWRPLDQGAKEYGTFMVLAFDAVLRAGTLVPTLIAVGLMAVILTSGVLLHLAHISPSGDVAAVIVAAPALFVPLTAPGDEFLVRRMFLAFRLMLYLVTVAGFGAAALIVTALPPSWKFAGWTLAALVSIICFVCVAAAVRRAWKIARKSDAHKRQNTPSS